MRDVSEQEKFLTEALGFRKTGVDGRYHRFEIGSGGANKTLVLLHEPDRAPGSWTFGAGTVHHIALCVADDEAMAAQKAIYEELGYTDALKSKIATIFTQCTFARPAAFWSVLLQCSGGLKRTNRSDVG